MTKKTLSQWCVVLQSVTLLLFASTLPAAETLRPPAVPLVTCDPYFSIWSPADKLTDADTVHWTGKPHRLHSWINIDGKDFQIMGKGMHDLPSFPQANVEVLPTRTVYTFEGEGLSLTLTFMTPMLPDDLDILSRPVTYISYAIHATDGKEHKCSVWFNAWGDIAVNEAAQQVVYSTNEVESLSMAKIGSVEQPILQKKGDDLRIDWGYLYVAAPKSGMRALATHRSTGGDGVDNTSPAPGW